MNDLSSSSFGTTIGFPEPTAVDLPDPAEIIDTFPKQGTPADDTLMDAAGRPMGFRYRHLPAFQQTNM